MKRSSARCATARGIAADATGNGAAVWRAGRIPAAAGPRAPARPSSGRVGCARAVSCAGPRHATIDEAVATLPRAAASGVCQRAGRARRAAGDRTRASRVRALRARCPAAACRSAAGSPGHAGAARPRPRALADARRGAAQAPRRLQEGGLPFEPRLRAAPGDGPGPRAVPDRRRWSSSAATSISCWRARCASCLPSP